jgi:hypothetical protein
VVRQEEPEHLVVPQEHLAVLQEHPVGPGELQREDRELEHEELVVLQQTKPLVILPVRLQKIQIKNL